MVALRDAAHIGRMERVESARPLPLVSEALRPQRPRVGRPWPRQGRVARTDDRSMVLGRLPNCALDAQGPILPRPPINRRISGEAMFAVPRRNVRAVACVMALASLGLASSA